MPCGDFVYNFPAGLIDPGEEFMESAAKWYTKAEVRELLSKEYFAARTQSYCYLWSKG